MFRDITKVATAVALGLVLNGVAYSQSNENFAEAFSNSDGSVQFILLGFYTPVPVLAGQTLIASDGKTEHTFTFPGNVADCHSFACEGVWVLVATQGFADLKLVEPDFVVPNGFLFLPGGSVRLSVSEAVYDALPTDGWNARWWWGPEVSAAIAINSAGESYSFKPIPGSFMPIGPGFTGAWYDPAQSGHGLFIEVLPDNHLFAGWFTFNPAGNQQAWFVGAGTFIGNTATISAMSLPTGGRWIPNFDPSRVVNNPWGTLTFSFTDCNHGKVDFSSTLGYGAGSMNLTRLTQPAGLSCP